MATRRLPGNAVSMPSRKALKNMVVTVNSKGERTYQRTEWIEWLRVYVVEGEMIPYFYLPVRRLLNRRSYEVWIMPVAPFVLLFLLAFGAARKVWWDLTDIVEIYSEDKESRKYGTYL